MSAADIQSLVEDLARTFDEFGYSLSVAESCTGGMLAAAITDLPGVSSFFLGGVVSYANEVKHDLLNVPDEMLATYGAVSEPTARAMAEGVRSRLGTDVGVGITGIAGPGGATDAKPVGLVYVAVADSAGSTCRSDVWSGDRTMVRRSSVEAALRLILSRVHEMVRPS